MGLLKNKRKLISIALCSLLMFSSIFSGGIYAQVENEDNNIKGDYTSEYNVDALENELNEVHISYLEEYAKDYKKYIKDNDLDANNLSRANKFKLDNIQDIYLENAQNEKDEILKKYGFEKVTSENDSQISSRANSPADLKLSDNAYYNSRTAEYRFVGTWNFRSSSYDTYDGQPDIVAFRMNDSYYNIKRSYARSYNNWGKETGYDKNGSNSSTSLVTKKKETKYGVAWNVAFSYVPKQDLYGADNGEISIYVKRKSSAPSGDTTKAFIEFEHNYKKVSLNNQFSITGVDIKSSGLSVSYSGKPVKYDRCSTGKFFSK